MNEQPEFDFSKERIPVPQEELDEIYEWIEDLEFRFPLEKLNAIIDENEAYDSDERDVARSIFLEINSMFTDLCNKYEVSKVEYEPIMSKLKEISAAIGHIDSVSGKVIHE